ncbi:MAG TPA: hypothetical protein O0Y17_01750, partial [Methanocorpusculum sp.]|nr:hypothetical protein [Methanocorpusculum sp.]
HIKMSALHRLEMLHDIILKETQFDDIWHLHSFFMDNKAYKSDYEIPCVEAAHEDNLPGTLTDRDYRIFDLHLYLGQKFMYIFDFGDDWRFTCTVIDILKEPTDMAEVIASKGNPPIQYPYLNDKK